MYKPSAPKFELNDGTARWILHYLNTPPPLIRQNALSNKEWYILLNS